MMDPTPPRKTKGRPFYVPPSKPASEIISEARTALSTNETRSSLRSLKATRPFTPRDERRTLFGSASSRNPDTRPPSAFSLGSRHFDGPDSRPVSGTRLTPLDYIPKSLSEQEVESLLLPPKPPSDPNKSKVRKSSSRPRLEHANSVDGSGVSSQGLVRHKSGSLTDIASASSGSEADKPESTRRIHSGPKERTSLLSEERGEGDGKETPARAPSSASIRSPPRSAGSRNGVESRVGGRDGSDSRVGSGGSKRTSSAGSAGRLGSGGKRDVDDGSEEFYSQQIAPILEELAALQKKKDAVRIHELTEHMYSTMEKGNMLGKNCRQRSSILKTIFKLLDVDDPKLLLRLARLILSFKVSGNNLLNVCKLVFKVSKNEKNDPEFLQDNILELLMDTVRGTDHISANEALIYSVGSIKFLTGNSKIVKQLVKLDCIEGLAILLTNINKTNRENSKGSEQQGHILVQLTAALRNLADANSSRQRILNSRLIDGLCCVTESYAMDCDIVLNISRIFSKITLHTDCCKPLADHPTVYKSFINLLNRHQEKDDIVVRVCFILGNLTAKNDDARMRLFQEPNGFDVLLSVLRSFLEMDVKSRGKEKKKESGTKENGDDGHATNKVEDVLIKVVRVIANLCINESVGPVIASHQQCFNLLLNILECKDLSKSEELVLNTVATVNNLSFYNTKNSAIIANQIPLLECLLKLLLIDNMEATIEVARVFGNLTRQKVVRDFLTEKKVDHMMIALLDSGNKEVVYIACGVLINFMADEEKRATLKKEGGILKLVEVLRDMGKSDWELASLVCQTLWNYSGKITSANDCFGEREAHELMELLIEYLDKDTAFDCAADDDMDDSVLEMVQETWAAEFCPVAEQLLHRVESHQSNFDPIESPAGS